MGPCLLRDGTVKCEVRVCGFSSGTSRGIVVRPGCAIMARLGVLLLVASCLFILLGLRVGTRSIGLHISRNIRFSLDNAAFSNNYYKIF
jgi:hypothetical protein